MPMVWDAQAEAKLFSAIIQVTDIKLSGDNLKKIAEFMGEECTPKAVTHRISKYKTLAKAAPGEGAEGGGKKAAAPKTKGKTGKAAKKADTPVDDEEGEGNGTGNGDGDGDDDEIEVKQKTPARKRKPTAKVEEAAASKKVKTEEEDGEDAGEDEL